MKYETAAAFRAALLTRLRQQAQTEGASVDRLRKRVVFERLLARLVRVTPERWALKGALALDFRQPVRARATMDADLVTEADIEQLTADLLTATRLDLDDHFIFRARRIRDADSEQPEPTVRFHLTVELAGQVFDEATLDVAVNTHADWKPERVRSHLLEFAGLPPVEIPVIPSEVHVAEKVHAYARSYGATGQASTRSKDLVDIIVIAETTPLDAAALNEALHGFSSGATRIASRLPFRLRRQAGQYRTVPLPHSHALTRISRQVTGKPRPVLTPSSPERPSQGGGTLKPGAGGPDRECVPGIARSDQTGSLAL